MIKNSIWIYHQNIQILIDIEQFQNYTLLLYSDDNRTIEEQFSLINLVFSSRLWPNPFYRAPYWIYMTPFHEYLCIYMMVNVWTYYGHIAGLVLWVVFIFINIYTVTGCTCEMPIMSFSLITIIYNHFVDGHIHIYIFMLICNDNASIIEDRMH